jgi:hypothetical protein
MRLMLVLYRSYQQRKRAMTPARQHFSSFKEFYPFYLSEHANTTCRRLHFAGSLCALAILVAALVAGRPLWLLAMPVAGYGFAWIGHFGFEKNKPASFRHPLYSFMGDWVMFGQLLTGKQKM